MAVEWQVSMDLKAAVPIDDDTVFDLLERLGAYGAAVAVGADGVGVSLTLCVTAQSGLESLTVALGLLSEAGMADDVQVCGFEVVTWSEAERRNREPLFPAVVGYAEVARMAGVSRQRAAMFPRIDSFPKPVIRTAQGPLFAKAAVAAWVAGRQARPGRPRVAARQQSG